MNSLSSSKTLKVKSFEIFSLLNLKKEISFKMQSILVFISFFQTFSLTFAHKYEGKWGFSEESFVFFHNFYHTVELSELFDHYDLEELHIFLVFGMMFVIVLILSILGILYSIELPDQDKIEDTSFFKIMGTLLHIYIPCLFLPFSASFLYYFFKTSSQLIYIFSGVGQLLSVILGLICYIMMYSIVPNPKDDSVRINCKTELIEVSIKYIILFDTHIPIDSTYFVGAILFLFNAYLISYYGSFSERSYYNEKIHMLWRTCTIILKWEGISLCILEFLKSNSEIKSGQIWLFLLIFLASLSEHTIFELQNQYSHLFSIKYLSKYKCDPKPSIRLIKQTLHTLSFILYKVTTGTVSNILVAAYFFSHQKKCEKRKCICKKINPQESKYKKSYLLAELVKEDQFDFFLNIEKTSKFTCSGKDQFQLLFLEYLLITKNFASLSRKIKETTFLQDTSFSFKYAVFQINKVLKQKILSSNNYSFNNATFQKKHEAALIQNINEVCINIEYFWLILSDQFPNMRNYALTAEKVDMGMQQINQSWKVIQNNLKPHLKAFVYYSLFKVRCLGDHLEINQYKSLIELNLIGVGDIGQNYYRSDSPCLFVSKDKNNEGIITHCNISLSSIIGEMPNLLKGKSFTHIIHPLFADPFEKYFFNEIGLDNLAKKQSVYIIHKYGCIMPMICSIVESSSLSMMSTSILRFDIDTHYAYNAGNEVHFLLDKHKGILNATFNINTILEYTNKEIKSNNINLEDIFPEIFAKDHSGFPINHWFEKFEGDMIVEVKKIFDSDHSQLGFVVKFINNQNDRTRESSDFFYNTSEKESKHNYEIKFLEPLGKYYLFDKSLVDDEIKLFLSTLSPNYRKESFLDGSCQTIAKHSSLECQIKDNINEEIERLKNVIENFGKRHNFGNILEKSQKRFAEFIYCNPSVLTQYRTVIHEIETLMSQKQGNYACNISTYVCLNNNIIEKKNNSKSLLSEQENIDAEEGSSEAFEIYDRSKVYQSLKEIFPMNLIHWLKFLTIIGIIFQIIMSVIMFIEFDYFFENIDEYIKIMAFSVKASRSMQEIVFPIREMVLINEEKLTEYESLYGSTKEEYSLLQKNYLETSIIEFLDYYLEMSERAYQRQKSQEYIYYFESQQIILKELDKNALTTYYGYIRQEIFKLIANLEIIKNQPLEEFRKKNPDIFSSIYNSLNGLFLGILQSNNFFAKDLGENSSGIPSNAIILFSSATILLFFLYFLFLYIGNKIFKSRNKPFELLLKIPFSYVEYIASQCNYFSTLLNESSDLNTVEDELEIQMEAPKSKQSKSRHRNYVSRFNTQKKYSFGLLFGIIIMEVYFIISLFLETDYLNNISDFSGNYNMTLKLNQVSIAALNFQRELFYNDTRIHIYEADCASKASQYTYMVSYYEKQCEHLLEICSSTLSDTYANELDNLFTQSLCPLNILSFDSIEECEGFQNGIATHGLKGVLNHFSFFLYLSLDQYFEYISKNKSIEEMFNIVELAEIKILRRKIVSPVIDKLFSYLELGIHEKYNSVQDRRLQLLFAFLSFIILITILFWKFFINFTDQKLQISIRMIGHLPLPIINQIDPIFDYLKNCS